MNVLEIILSIAFNFAFLLIALEDQKKGTVYDWHCYLLIIIAALYKMVLVTRFELPIIPALSPHYIEIGTIPIMIVVVILNQTKRLGMKEDYFGYADVLVFLAIAIAYPAILAWCIIASVLLAEAFIRWKHADKVHFIPFLFIAWCVLVTLYYDLPRILALFSSIV